MTTKARWMRRVAWVLAGLFALSAVVQLNDPDWGPWFAFYLAATAAAVLAPRKGPGLPAVMAGVAAVWCIAILSQGLDPITWGELFGDLTMKTLNVERWREAGGLGIVAVGLGGLAWGVR